MQEILKATVIDAQQRWGVEGYGIRAEFWDGTVVEEYVDTEEEAALAIAQESLERGVRYFWEHVEGWGLTYPPEI